MKVVFIIALTITGIRFVIDFIKYGKDIDK